MEFAISRLAKILIATLLMLAFGVQSAIASESDSSIKISVVEASDLVTVNSRLQGNDVLHTIKVTNLPSVVFRAAKESDLTEAEHLELNEVRSDLLDKTVTALVLGTTDLPTLINDKALINATEYNKPARFDYSLNEMLKGDDFQVRKRRSILRIRAEALLKSFEKYSDKKIELANEYKFFAFIWENMFRSTAKAWKSYKKNFRGSKGYREFGLSFVLRGEFQVGVGKTNIMRTIARGLDIGYDIPSKELVIRRVVRHEKMDGGTAMAIGPKFEIRGYRANLEFHEHLENNRHVHGKSWYPPAIPGITLASETFPGYHSTGTAFALNPFDLVVPTFIFNTVNEFDADYSVRRISLNPFKYARPSVSAVKQWLNDHVPHFMGDNSARIVNDPAIRTGPMANQCQAIFSRAN